MHIHQVLQDVSEIRRRLVSSGYFFGYSPTARFAGGAAALLGAALLSMLPAAYSPWTHFIGWGVVFAVAAPINYIALFSRHRFARDQLCREAVLDPLLLILTGGAATAALAYEGAFGLLFALWMVFFGFANVAAKRNFSREVALVGYYYVAAGWVFLLVPLFHTFTNPWPMGIVFFVGESAGAYAFYLHNEKNKES